MPWPKCLSIALMADKVAKVADFVSIGQQRPDPVHAGRRPYLGSVQLPDRMASGCAARAIKMICDAGNANGTLGGVRREAAAIGSGRGAGRFGRQLPVHDPGGSDDALAEVTLEGSQAEPPQR